MLEAIITSSCSPDVHPLIVNAIVKTESNYNPFAIGVNKGGRLTKQPTNLSEAVQTAKRLLAGGANIDMGLGQINSANLQWLGLTVEQIFHPCLNLQALQTVYLHCYNRAGNTGKGTKIQRAFSCYNTGNTAGGFNNGYVNKVTDNYNDLVVNTKLVASKSSQHSLSNPISQPYQTYNAVDAPVNAIDGVQFNFGSKIPNYPQNANTSLYARSSDTTQLTQPQHPENNPVEQPVKVFNTWDVFRDF